MTKLKPFENNETKKKKNTRCKEIELPCVEPIMIHIQ
jgi:hypothetical protein